MKQCWLLDAKQTQYIFILHTSIILREGDYYEGISCDVGNECHTEQRFVFEGVIMVMGITNV